jgi:hypothetical protein
VVDHHELHAVLANAIHERSRLADGRKPDPGGEPGSYIAQKVLQDNRIRFLDLIPCVSQVPEGERFVALHYSAASNAAVAGCLREALARGFQSSYEAGVRNISSISTW